MASTNTLQSIAPSERRLPIVLLTETWSAACCWVSDCTICSIVRLDSASRCSTQVSGNASASPWSWRRRTSSATNGPTIGGFERAMSAMTRIRLLGSLSAISVIWSAQRCASLAWTRVVMIRELTRRRFSISASRNMIGIAHSSPSVSGVTDWYAATKRASVRESTRPSPWEMASSAMS